MMCIQSIAAVFYQPDLLLGGCLISITFLKSKNKTDGFYSQGMLQECTVSCIRYKFKNIIQHRLQYNKCNKEKHSFMKWIIGCWNNKNHQNKIKNRYLETNNNNILIK